MPSGNEHYKRVEDLVDWAVRCLDLRYLSKAQLQDRLRRQAKLWSEERFGVWVKTRAIDRSNAVMDAADFIERRSRRVKQVAVDVFK